MKWKTIGLIIMPNLFSRLKTKHVIWWANSFVRNHRRLKRSQHLRAWTFLSHLWLISADCAIKSLGRLTLHIMSNMSTSKLALYWHWTLNTKPMHELSEKQARPFSLLLSHRHTHKQTVRETKWELLRSKTDWWATGLVGQDAIHTHSPEYTLTLI